MDTTLHSAAVRPLLKRRWIVLACMVLARTGIGVQFASVPALMPGLIADLGLDYAQIGLLLGVYMLAGAVLALPSGMISARLGADRVLQLGFAALIGGSLLCGTGGSFAALLAGRTLGGVGAVLLTVTAARVLTDWFTGREIATAMSLLGVTWPAGIALGLSLLPTVSALAGWQAAMLAPCLVPAAALVLCSLVPTDGEPQPGRKPAPSDRPPLWCIDRRELAAIIVGGAAWPLMAAGGYSVFTSFAPALLTARGSSPVEASLAVSLLSWLTIATIPLGGLLADRTGWRNALFIGGCLASGAAIAMVPLGGPPQLWIVLAAVIGLTVGPVLALPGQVLAPASRSTGLGLFFALYYLGSTVLPAAAGWLHDLTASASATVWFSAACLCLAPVSLVALRCLQRRWGLGGEPA